MIRYFSDGSLAAPLFPGTGDSAFPPYVHIHPEQAQARETLLNVLREQHWNLSAAARVLHITRATLYKRLKKYNITVQRRGSWEKVLPQNKLRQDFFLLLAVLYYHKTGQISSLAVPAPQVYPLRIFSRRDARWMTFLP